MLALLLDVMTTITLCRLPMISCSDMCNKVAFKDMWIFTHANYFGSKSSYKNLYMSLFIRIKAII